MSSLREATSYQPPINSHTSYWLYSAVSYVLWFSRQQSFQTKVCKCNQLHHGLLELLDSKLIALKILWHVRRGWSGGWPSRYSCSWRFYLTEVLANWKVVDQHKVMVNGEQWLSHAIGMHHYTPIELLLPTKLVNALRANGTETIKSGIGGTLRIQASHPLKKNG